MDPHLFTPFQRLTFRLGLALRFDPRGQKAWGKAATQPGRAQALVAAGVPCPPSERACWPWLDALLQSKPGFNRADMDVWIRSLPLAAGGIWRTRALWTAVMALNGPAVFTLVTAGANDDFRESAGGGNLPLIDPPLPLIVQLLRRTPPTQLKNPDEALVMNTLACWVEADPGGLRKAWQSLGPSVHSWDLWPFNANNLRRLAAMGVSFSGPFACPWFDCLLAPAPYSHPHPRRMPDDDALHGSMRALFELGADPLVRWPNGDTLLHRLLRTDTHLTQYKGNRMGAWFELLTGQGADPLAVLPSGDTLLHTAFRIHNAELLPMQLVDAVVARRPSDLTKPGADGKCPLALLEMQTNFWPHPSPAAQALLGRLRCDLQASQLTAALPAAPLVGDTETPPPKRRRL